MPPRCSYREGRRQCPYAGSGTPVLCDAHRLALETVGAQDPIEAMLSNASAAMMSEFDKLLQRGREAVRRSIPGAPQRTHRSQRERGKRAAAPPQPPEPPKRENPRTVLGFRDDEPLTKRAVKERQRALAELFHPDRGGSVAAMQRVNEAAQELIKEIM